MGSGGTWEALRITCEPIRRSKRSGKARTAQAAERADGRTPRPGSPPPPQMAHVQICSREPKRRAVRRAARRATQRQEGGTACSSAE